MRSRPSKQRMDALDAYQPHQINTLSTGDNTLGLYWTLFSFNLFIYLKINMQARGLNELQYHIPYANLISALVDFYLLIFARNSALVDLKVN